MSALPKIMPQNLELLCGADVLARILVLATSVLLVYSHRNMFKLGTLATNSRTIAIAWTLFPTSSILG